MTAASISSQIERLPVDSLTPHAKNSRTHSEPQIQQIAASISAFGFTNPVLIDEQDGIIAGHGRVMAARSLGLEAVPCLRLSGLTDAQKRAYVIADNQLALNAGWDEDLLRSELLDLRDHDFNLDLVGFNENELNLLLSGAEQVAEGLTDEEDAPEPQPEAISKPGDVWLLGKHRVMCGDSTSVDALDRLMAGRKPEMVFTDPPYNIGYQGVKDRRKKIANDELTDNEFLDFLRQSLLPCDVMYVCCSWQFAHLFKLAMKEIERPAKAMIVWDKTNPAQHLDLYFKQHELIFYHGPFGGQKTVRGDVWALKRQRNTVHPTMKPVELVEMALSDHPSKKVVFDGFGGSGSTLIACEKLARHAMVMEIDPSYCDVIVQRWQEFTGNSAVLEGTGEEFSRLRGAE